MTPETQRLRNAIGQRDHTIARLVEQRREMQADLIRQRQDMTDAIAALDAGSTRDARAILSAGIDYRNRTREQRKVTA